MKRGGSKAKVWIGASLIIVVGAYAAYRLSRPSAPSRTVRVAQLDKSIRTELPARATRAQVKAWFQRHKISYGYMDGKKYKLDDESFVVESGVPVKNIGGVMTGGFRIPAEQLFEDNCSINIAFFMDKNDKVIKHQVGWVCAGL
jgi:hypothetical protein